MPEADAEGRRVASGRGSCTNVAHLVDEAVGVGREAEQLGQLPDDDGDGQAVHVADLDLVGEQVGDEAELADAETDLDQPDHEQRQHPGQGDGGRGVVATHRASGAIAAKISGDTDESGPSTRTRDGPMIAYPTRQAIVV